MTNLPSPRPVDARPVIVGHHYPHLDGIRGIAILLVLLFHCASVTSPRTVSQELYFTLASAGWIGVDLFFVLSGFLITGILIDTYHSPFYFRNFYIRRALRILPLYYFVIILFTVFTQLSVAEAIEFKSPLIALSYWIYLPNWLPLFNVPQPEVLGHFWSLAIEEQFYLIWPALVLFAARRKKEGKLCLLVLIVSIVSRVVLVALNQKAYYFTVSRMDGLALGGYVSILFRRYGSLIRFRSRAFVVAAISMLMVGVVALFERRFYGHDPMLLIFGLLPLALFFSSCLVITLSSTRGTLRSILSNRELRFVGGISYGVYVFHWPIIFFLNGIWGHSQSFWVNHIVFTVIALSLSLFVAWVSYRFFEGPILRLKHRYAPSSKVMKPAV